MVPVIPLNYHRARLSGSFAPSLCEALINAMDCLMSAGIAQLTHNSCFSLSQVLYSAADYDTSIQHLSWLYDPHLNFLDCLSFQV